MSVNALAMAAASLFALSAPSLASGAVHKLTNDPKAQHPDIAVDEKGTAHVVWQRTGENLHDDVIYCRVPRGARSCAATRSFGLTGVADPPKINFTPTGDLVISSERFRDDPAGLDPESKVYAITSTNGGKTFGPPKVIANRAGTIWGWGGDAEPGPGNFSLSLIGNSGGANQGLNYSAAPLDGFTTQTAELTADWRKAAYPSVAFVDPTTPIAAYSNLDKVFFRRWSGSGGYNTTSSWLPEATAPFPGTEPRLSGGFRGVYLMYSDKQAPSHYRVRRYNSAANTFGRQTRVSDNGTSAIFGDFIHDGGGTLHAIFLERPNGSTWELRHAIQRPGESWRSPQKLATENQTSNGFFNLRVGAAPDAGGAVVADGNSKGPIYFVPFAPTGGTGACAPTIKIGQAVVRALTGCFKKQKNGSRVAAGPVKVNGIDIEPSAGAAPGARADRSAASGAFMVTADPDARTLTTSATANVKVGNVMLDRGKIAWKLPQGTGSVERIGVGDPSVFKDIGKFTKKLFEFPVKGDAELLIGKGETAKIPTNFQLPSLIGDVSGAVTLNTTVAGLNLDKLHITAPQAAIGLLRISNIRVSYDGQNRFTGSASFDLPPGYFKGFSGGFGFEDGRLNLVHVDKSFTPMLPIITPPEVGVPPEPIVGLDKLGIKYQNKLGSRTFTGTVLFIGGGKYFGKRAARLDGTVTLEFPASGPTTLDALGKLSVVGLPLANAEIKYTVPDLLTFDGTFAVPIVSVGLSVKGWVSVANPPRFSAAGSANLGLGTSAEAVISSKGWSGCLHLPDPAPDLGAHQEWGDVFPEMGCDVGAFNVAAPATPSGKVAQTPWFLPRGRIAASATVVRIPGGLPQAELEISGTGGAPRVTVTAPDGGKVTSGPGNVVQGRFIATELPQTKRTYVAIGKPPKGAYTIVPLPGSVAVRSVKLARGLPDPKVSGRVSAKGRKRILRYRIRKIAGQKVTFAEQSAGLYRELATSKKARGKLVFRPVDSRRRKRKIVALVAQNGFPRARLNVARFTAPKPLALAKPKVKVMRKSKKLVATWKKIRGARGYRVVVALPKDGRRLLRFLKPNQTKLKVGGLEPDDNGWVTVQAVGSDARPGKAGKAKLKFVKGRHGRR